MTAPAIVAATVFHAGVVAALHALCFPEDAWDPASVAGLLAEETVDGLLLCAPTDRPLGFALVRSVSDEAEILTIGIRPEAQGRGLGALLIGVACDTAARRGAERIFLEVSEGNRRALSMYRRAGFDAVGRRRDYYGAGVDALVLRRTVARGPAA